MSELRIALVAEGPTDFEVIQAVLKAVLPKPFIMTQLQPEPTQPQIGTGWCGVLKWCYQTHQRQHGLLMDDPTLASFDLIIIHLDVDVAHQQYLDCGETVETWAKENSWQNLPCIQPCPPISPTANILGNVITSWLGQAKPCNRTIFCLPAQSSGTWLAAVILPSTELSNIECNRMLESQLAQLPKKQRIKKTTREYRMYAPRITEQWSQIKHVCTQAKNFEQLILRALSHTESSMT
jgi:hypothetical protein